MSLDIDGIEIRAADEQIALGARDWAGLSEALAAVAARHHTHGKLILVPTGDVRHETLIAAMDASREPFPGVVIAGGVP